MPRCQSRLERPLGPDIYRNFTIPVRVPEGKYVKAIEYRPGNPRIVHHAVLSTLTGAARLTDSGEGIDRGVAPISEVFPGGLGIWAPGKDAFPMPAGFDHHLVKPVDAAELNQLLAERKS